MIKRILNWLEDKRDIRSARKSLKEGGSVPWDLNKFLAELDQFEKESAETIIRVK